MISILNPDSNEFSVYVIGCKYTDKVYFGKAHNPKARFQQHMTNKNGVFTEDILKYGKDSFIMIVLKSGLTHDEAIDLEALYIYKYYFLVPLYNRMLPGDPCYGRSKYAAKADMAMLVRDVRCDAFGTKQSKYQPQIRRKFGFYYATTRNNIAAQDVAAP